jgi:predicted nucleotidyltransferase
MRYTHVVDLEARLRALLEPHRDCLAAWLFGSRARGTATESSDVDVAVLLAEPRPRGLAALPTALEDELERELGARVDVVVLNEAPVDLVHRVLRDGRLVCEHDRAARIRFEVRKRNEFWDLEPVLRRYRRAPGASP